jgi:hypothetical protein
MAVMKLPPIPIPVNDSLSLHIQAGTLLLVPNRGPFPSDRYCRFPAVPRPGHSPKR